MSTAPSPLSVRARWEREYHQLERGCPWAGPRPLSRALDADAPYRFVGRETETGEFVELVRSNRLIVFHAESGAGKSSLLDMSLFDTLFGMGYAVLPCRSWEALGDQDPESFLTSEFRKADLLHPAVIDELDAGLGLTGALDELYGLEERAVIILDQFEELIRNRRPGVFNRVVDWILEVNKSREVKIVISMRSEYQHRLTRLIKAARPFSTAYFELPVMQDAESIERVVASANSASSPAIEEDAVEAFMEQWTHRREAGEHLTLLAVQAALYSLHDLARTRALSAGSANTVTVTVADVEKLRTEAAGFARAAGAAVDLFGYAFNHAIEVRLAHCMQACTLLGPVLPPAFVHLTRASVVDASPHLSSGGYKLEREIGDLFARSKDREARLAGWTRDEVGEAAAALRGHREQVDLLAAPRAELASLLGMGDPDPPLDETERALAAQHGVYPIPWLDDGQDISAGTMLAYPSEALLIEQVRAFLFAIEWLEICYLARVTSNDEGTSVALVHDGFGAPLETWASRVGVDPWTATCSIVAHEGRRFEFGDAKQEPPFVNPEEHPRYLLNLRWRYCRINRAVFRNVVFANCDFRGAVFERCYFTGVTFINCLLDGATFDTCTVEGTGDVGFDFVPPAPGEEQEKTGNRPESELPDFLLTGLEVSEALADLQWYRKADPAADSIYSPTSGVAAVPAVESQQAGVTWRRQTRGVVMYGGRLSSLMVKDCTFVAEGDSDGSITLAFMAGSSLDFVEQGAGCVRLYFTTVRGLSVTNKVDASRRVPGENFELLAYECVLASTFFGEGIDGHATIWSSVVLGISNASAGFDVLVADSQQAGGDNVNFGSGTDLEGFGTGRPSAEAREILEAATRAMAYRSTPAQLEVQARMRAGS